MPNPQRPLSPAERTARVQSRIFPGSGGGFISGVAPVRERKRGTKTNGSQEMVSGREVQFAYDFMTVP